MNKRIPLKPLAIIVSLLVSSSFSYAQQRMPVEQYNNIPAIKHNAQGEAARVAMPMTLKEVTLYLQGAELYSLAALSLPEGESTLVFCNIADNLNEQTLSLKASNGVVIQSTVVQKVPIVQKTLVQSDADALNQQLEQAVLEQQRRQAQLKVLETKITLIETNQTLSSNKSNATVADIERMLDLINEQMAPLLLKKIDLEMEINQLEQRIAQTQKVLVERAGLKDQQKLVRQLVVRVYAPKKTAATLSATYTIADAGWVPFYNIHADEAKGLVNLLYKANVYQRSGFDWSEVKLTLSTGNPAQGAALPTLQPWYIGLYLPQKSSGFLSQKSYAMKEDISMSEPMANRVRNDQEESESLDNYLHVNNHGVDVAYAIDLPYTIPFDNRMHQVALKTEQVKGDFHYIAIPKVDKDAFLQVRIPDWDTLNLLSGKTNVYYDNAYVGEGYIDVDNPAETLDISLGRNKKIVINRKNTQNKRNKPQFLGSNTTQTYGYEYEIRNGYTQPISLTIMDQLPVSRDERLTLIDLVLDHASHDEKTGALMWRFDLKPGAQQRINYSYKVKYPKEGAVNGL